MEVTLSGRYRLEMPQPASALSPMVVTLSGILISESWDHL